MIPDEQEELDRLCRTVVDEKNSAKLTEAVATLNEFLEERERKKPNPGPPRRPGALGAKNKRGNCAMAARFTSTAPTAKPRRFRCGISMEQKTPRPQSGQCGNQIVFLLACGSLHRNQPSANRVTKSAYFSFSMIFANQSATITSPMIKSAVKRSLPDCSGRPPRFSLFASAQRHPAT
jgi:hypothetical protein